MKQYFVFLKKELLESLRNFKFYLLLTIFTIFGILSPLTAKLMPLIMKMAMPKELNITLPEPSGMDSWQQFFKNIQQLGLFVVVLMFAGILVQELTKGTLINLLTKGLSRKVVIFAKFSVMVLLWTMSIFLSFGVTYAYNLYYFPQDIVSYLGFSVMCLWLFGIFLISLILLASTLVATTSGVLFITGGAVVFQMLLNIFPKAWKYNPLSLATKNMALLGNTLKPEELTESLVVTLSVTVISIVLSLLIFNKKEI